MVHTCASNNLTFNHKMFRKSSTIVALVVVVFLTNSNGGLLRVPKIYNTVITSDANLEPSRAYPIVQPVVTVGVTSVQPVLAPTSKDILQQQQQQQQQYQQPLPSYYGVPAFYPIAVGDVYPFLATTNALYPTSVLYQPALVPSTGLRQSPTSAHAQRAAVQPPAAALSQSASPVTPNRQMQGDVLNNSHRLKNPDIPDVPPPPLPVGVNKNT